MTTLFEKLSQAGIPVISADKSGAISTNPMTEDQIVVFTNICLEHISPVEYATRKRAAERKAAAKGEAALAEQLKTVTAQGAVDYIETQVTNLASAKAVMKIMARMLIAMRDEVWPELPEE